MLHALSSSRVCAHSASPLQACAPVSALPVPRVHHAQQHHTSSLNLWNARRKASGRQQRHLLPPCAAAPPQQEEDAPQLRSMMKRARADIEEHLASPKGRSIPEGPQVLAWFDSKLSGPRDPQLETTVTQLIATGNVGNLIKVLASLMHVEDRHRTGSASPTPTASMQEDPAGQSRRAQLAELFQKLDTAQKGAITLTQFFHGLDMLREFMSDEELELIGSSMDGQGRITQETFLDVVMTAHASHGSRQSTLLHHLGHKGPSDNPVDKFQ